MPGFCSWHQCFSRQFQARMINAKPAWLSPELAVDLKKAQVGEPSRRGNWTMGAEAGQKTINFWGKDDNINFWGETNFIGMPGKNLPLVKIQNKCSIE